jgi:Fe-S-cluster containining protein
MDPPLDDLRAFVDHVVEQQSADASAALAGGRTPLTILSLAERTAARVEALSDRSPEKSQRACRAGCAACCRLAVSILPIEAVWIAGRLRATRASAELAALRERVSTTSRLVSHLTIFERAGARIPCAMLDARGNCSIYEFRPLGCRGWTSFSRQPCEAALSAARPGHDGPRDRVASRAASGATEGLETALRRAGLDATAYEFHAALLRALDTPDAAARWADGERVFEGCARVGWQTESSAPPTETAAR